MPRVDTEDDRGSVVREIVFGEWAIGESLLQKEEALCIGWRAAIHELHAQVPVDPDLVVLRLALAEKDGVQSFSGHPVETHAWMRDVPHRRCVTVLGVRGTENHRIAWLDDPAGGQMARSDLRSPSAVEPRSRRVSLVAGLARDAPDLIDVLVEALWELQRGDGNRTTDGDAVLQAFLEAVPIATIVEKAPSAWRRRCANSFMRASDTA